MRNLWAGFIGFHTPPRGLCDSRYSVKRYAAATEQLRDSQQFKVIMWREEITAFARLNINKPKNSPTFTKTSKNPLYVRKTYKGFFGS